MAKKKYITVTQTVKHAGVVTRTVRRVPVVKVKDKTIKQTDKK